MISKYDLKIEESLYNFINLEVIPDTDINIDEFWKNFSELIADLTPINRNLLETRNEFQKQLDEWYKKKTGQEIKPEDYKQFLLDIGYLLEEGEDFLIDTKHVDDEISNISGPQLVVPITNSRYALNAVNARWGSFYDALYGTNVIDDISSDKDYDPLRGDKVINFAKKHLDKIFPLTKSNLAI